MNQQLKAFLLSYGRLFVASCIAAYWTVNKSPLELDFADGKVILAAGVSALILAVGNALNPSDQRYGIGAPAPKDVGYGALEVLVAVLVVVILVLVILRLA